MKRRQLLLALAAAGCATARADQYPERPITFIVPFPVGGSVDVVARAVGQRLSAQLKQAVVVDNRAGAGGVIGANAVAKAKKDGYTLLVSSSSTHSLAAALKTNLPYDPQKDFAPVIELALGSSSLLVPESMPVRTVPELVAYMKQRGDNNSFGSPGIATLGHLSAEDFKQATGVQMTHVPYKGNSLAVTDLAEGRLTLIFDSPASSQAYVRTGRVKMLAVGSAKRLAALPDVPTLAESGLRMSNPDGYFGIWAPAGTPDAIVTELNAALNAVLKTPDMLAFMQAQAVTPSGGTPAAFAHRIAGDTAQWKQIVQRAGITPE